MSKQIFPSHLIHYSVPENFNESDRTLFYDVNFNHTIRAVEMSHIQDVTLCNELLFSGKENLYEFTKHKFPSKKVILKSKLKQWFKPRRKIENAYLGIQDWNMNFFHWMTEMLPNIVALREFKQDNFSVVLSLHHKRNKAIVATLNILDIPIYFHDVKEVLTVSNLYAIKVPQVGFYNEALLFQMRSLFYKKINLDINITAFRKIYISRRKAPRRKIINEDLLIALLVKNGFETFYLEDFSIEEQIKLLYETRVVLSSHGAGLTNILFMQPSMKVIELKAQNNDYWCFFSLARLAQLDYYYLLCDSDTNNHRDANITVDIEKVNLLLRNLI